MSNELDVLKVRVERLEAAVGDVREELRNCLNVAGLPQDSLMIARRIADRITVRVLDDMGGKEDRDKAKSLFDERIKYLESQPVLSRGLVPQEILTLLHMVRVIGNKAAHDVLKIRPGASDVDLVLRSVLRIVEWYFAEFARGPKVDPLFMGVASLPPLRGAEPPPAVRAPALTIVGPGTADGPRKVFVFTDRLLGFGRQKTSRDPRVQVVTRLLPAPDASHPLFNRNLQNVSQFHAQIWWNVGRAEVRDEDSDKGVYVNESRVAPGVWTPCIFPNPAHVKLGPEGVEFSVAEIARVVDGAHVICLKLARLHNWPLHEYLMVSSPLVTIGSSPDAVAYFPDAPGLAATIRLGDVGWAWHGAEGFTETIEPGRTHAIGSTRLLVKRTGEEDFLS